MYTFEQLVKKAKEIHGDKYQYIKETYKKVSEPLKVICPEHGEFWQSFHQHINKKQGCPNCGIKKRSKKRHDTTESFIKKAVKIHGDKYNYSKVNYVNSYTKVCIICPEHGEFWQTPNCHLNGRGCPKCRQKTIKKRNFNKILSRHDFLSKCKEKFDQKYEYDLTQYKNLGTKINIYCPKHGWFEQTASAHLNSNSGCPKCSYEMDSLRKLKTNEEFIKKAVQVHGNKYDYSKIVYKDSFTKVCIICPIHGEFWQTPANHLTGYGCQNCNNSKLEIEIEDILKEFGIHFVEQYNEKELNRQRLDFFIPSKKIAIECQGIQHFFPVYFNKKNKENVENILKHNIILDKRKKDICEQLGYHMLYYTKKNIIPNDLMTNKIFQGLYEKNNVFFDKKELLKKIEES